MNVSFGARFSLKALQMAKKLKPNEDDVVAAGSGAVVAASPSIVAVPLAATLAPVSLGSLPALTVAHPTVSALVTTGAGVINNHSGSSKPEIPSED